MQVDIFATRHVWGAASDLIHSIHSFMGIEYRGSGKTVLTDGRTCRYLRVSEYVIYVANQLNNPAAVPAQTMRRLFTKCLNASTFTTRICGPVKLAKMTAFEARNSRLFLTSGAAPRPLTTQSP
jgi:hypothetical protein